jgi:4-oxalocrotonate tautomerase
MKPTIKLLFPIALWLITVPGSCQTENKAVMQQSNTARTTSMIDDIHAVSPALVMRILDRKEEVISVALEEVDPRNWTDKVYIPDIQGKWNTLYKKPGSNPFEK